MYLKECMFSSADANGRYYFQPEDIIRLEASDNYTYIYLTNKRKLVVAKVLKVYDEFLAPLGFIRTHRTHLVNSQHISSIKNDSHVVMKDTSVAGISRRLRKEVLRKLSK